MQITSLVVNVVAQVMALNESVLSNTSNSDELTSIRIAMESEVGIVLIIITIK